MNKRMVLFSVLCLVGVAVPAHADLFTQLSNFNQTAAGGPGDLLNVRQVDTPALAGVAYSNQYTASGGPQAGAKLRVVAAARINSVTLGTGALGNTNFGSNKVVAVFAGEATISIVGPNAVALFAPTAGNIGGRVGFFVSPDPTGFGFIAADPSTWAVVTVGPGGVTINNPLATFDLKPQENAFKGDPDAFSINTPASQTNIFSVNTANVQQFQGTVLFRDITDPLFTNLTQTGVNPADIISEGLIAIVTEQAADNLGPQGANALAILNAFAALLGQPNDIGGFAFATGFGNAVPTDFFTTTAFPADFLASGDLTTGLGLTFAPALQVRPIPEPASILGWSVAIATVLGCALVRRRRMSALAA
jgi:hypothetical protein